MSKTLQFKKLYAIINMFNYKIKLDKFHIL